MVKWIVKQCLLPYSTGWERKTDAEKYCPVRHFVLRRHLAESKFSSEETFPNMAAHGRCWWVQFSFWYQALNANLQAVIFVRRCKQPARCNEFRLLIYLNQLHMFRATNSSIFWSTFDCIYSCRYNAPILLRPVTTLSPVGSNIGTMYLQL